MKVYSPDSNYKLNKIKLAANIYGHQIAHQTVQFDTKTTKGFKEAYPHYSLPVLETQKGTFVTGSNAILLYLAGGVRALPNSAKVIQYLQTIEKQLEPATGILNLQINGYQELNEAQLEKSKQLHNKVAKELNDALALNTFLAGDKLTIADISSFHNLESVRSLFDKDWEKLKNLKRWMGHMRSIK